MTFRKVWQIDFKELSFFSPSQPKFAISCDQSLPLCKLWMWRCELENRGRDWPNWPMYTRSPRMTPEPLVKIVHKTCSPTLSFLVPTGAKAATISSRYWEGAGGLFGGRGQSIGPNRWVYTSPPLSFIFLYLSHLYLIHTVVISCLFSPSQFMIWALPQWTIIFHFLGPFHY